MYFEFYYEKKFRLNTSSFKKSVSPEFHHYQGAAYAPLFRILAELHVTTKNFDFIDIGCGKGRALFVAEYKGFNQLYGIELDKELLDDAKLNVSTFYFKRKESEFHFVHCNALDYNYRNSPSVYFLFNPFGDVILDQVLEKIKATSLSETYFVYMNPLFPQAFSKLNIPLFKTIKTGFYTEAHIYQMGHKDKVPT